MGDMGGIDVYGCVWVVIACMGVYECVWMYMGIYGCVWVCMVLYGCVCVRIGGYGWVNICKTVVVCLFNNSINRLNTQIR